MAVEMDGISAKSGGLISTVESAAVVRGATCFLLDLDGSGDGTHFLRGGGDIIELSTDLGSETSKGGPQFSDFVAMILPISESS